VDILTPAALTLRGDENKFIFVDRGIVHAGDTVFAKDLKETLHVTRGDLVEHFYCGLQDGLQWGIKKTKVERLLVAKPAYLADSLVPPVLTQEEVAAFAGGREASHLLTVDYCTFRLINRNQVNLEDNMLLRVYDVATGALIDTLVSDRLTAEMPFTADDYSGSISEFFYQKGWSYAEYLAPAWIPVERRIYMGHKLLNLGCYFLETNRPEQAGEVWATALPRKPSIAARAAVNVGWLLERDGEFEEAAQLLEETLDRVGPRHLPASLLRYIRQQIEVLKQRGEDDKKLKEQL
jgi:tetratricopeptide (TPR) repeat protein